jgi:hypothetical protein
MRKMITLTDLNRPAHCGDCKGIMVFQGLGQYKCEDCGLNELDDYGYARNYIEKNPGANVSEISDKTGVSRKSINNMVKEGRFEITKESRTFLLCEVCGINIRSGRVCKNCETAYHKNYEEDIRRTNIKSGYGKAERPEDAQGSKRFNRELL